MRLTSAVVLSSLLSGCMMYRLADLRQTTPVGSPFQTELSKLYMQFATDEEKAYDWANSWHFADKGLMSAYGKDVPPEDPKDWAISDAAKPELEEARAALVAALTPEMEHDRPGESANAQFYYDCWVKYQDAGWQEDNIAYCRDNFHAALSHLQPSKVEMPPQAAVPLVSQPVHKKAKKKPAAPRVMPEPLAEKPATGTVSYVVFFEKGQPILSHAGGKVMEDVVSSLKNEKDYEVVIKGGTDSPLAGERVDIVKELLVGTGIKENTITTEASPKAVARRVEIYLNQ